MKFIIFLMLLMMFNIHKMYTIMMLTVMMVSILPYLSFSPNSFSNFIFTDYLSAIMIYLSIISTILIILSMENNKKNKFLMLMILLLLMMVFMSTNMMVFYIMFEIILIPILMIITKEGKQPERLQAAIYLILYTILASLPLLIMILNLKNSEFITSMCISENFNMPLMFILAFLVKMPMFSLHLWLPKAHVEAPLEGSMILAAILLKLGGYGILRVSPMIMHKLYKMNMWIMSISILGASMTSMICIRQKDMKALIAYSSVSHMGLILTSMMTFKYMGIMGSIVMMVGHGISSSALFLLVNLIYSNYHTRNILSMKGMLTIFPNLTFWWFMFIAMNMSAPPSINLISEIMMMFSMISWSNTLMTMLLISSFMTSLFSIMLYINIFHNSTEMMMSKSNSQKYMLSLFLHLFILIMSVMYLEMMSL